jgi:P27 family predicted phage terminase small subunit
MAENKPPNWLDVEGKRQWRRLLPLLLAENLYKPGDSDMLAAMCQSLAEIITLTARLDQEGVIQTTRGGYMVPHPAHGMRNKAIEKYRKLALSFGITPAARQKLQIAAPEKTEEGEAEMFGE